MDGYSTKWKKLIALILMTFLTVGISSTVLADTKVHFIDVGQGQAVLVESDGEYMIYDGGGRDASSMVVSYLQSQGVNNIKYVVASHYDEDHLSGLIGCLNVFNVENVIGPDYSSDTSIYASFINKLNESGKELQYPEVGNEYSFGGASFKILAPAAITDNENNNSVVVKVMYGSTSFLFTGDAEGDEEQEMIASGMDLNSDVLLLGHHGSAYSTSESFLTSVNPQYAIISCGKYNSFGHPSFETMSLLENHAVHVYRTDLQGSVIASTDGDSIYWSQGPCDDYRSGGQVAEEQDVTVIVEEPVAVTNTVDYVLNTNTKKFHYPSCSSVDQMKEKNKQDYSGDRESLIAQGYAACKNCNP